MIPVKSVPKVILSAVIASVLFMSIMPDKLNGMPARVFYFFLQPRFWLGG